MMAEHAKWGKPNKNLLMPITNNPGCSSKESRKWVEDNTQPGYPDDSRQHLKYMFIAQCESLEQMIDDIRSAQTEIIKKLDNLESRRCTALAGCKSRHSKQISGHEEASSSASSTLAHTSDKRDSGFAERLQMLERLRRTRTSLVNDNRVTNLENTENVIVSKTRSLVYFSNVQRFRTILSASEQHGDCVAFQDVSTGATSDYNESLVVWSGLHTRKPQARQLKRFKTDMKEDNRIVSYEAQKEHVRDIKKLQSRTQAKEVTRHSQDDRDSIKSHKNKTETKTEISSTGESMTKPWAEASEDLMPKSKKMSTKYSMKGAQEQVQCSLRMAETLESSGNGFPFMNMSTLMRSSEMDLAYRAEIEEGRKHRQAGNSVETIICLDTSESMKGPPWTKAITFVKNFIQEVKNQPCGDSSVFEQIGLVTFGHVTRVQVHLTRNYHQVLSKLDTLLPNGPTPMMPGLKMCVAAIVGGGSKLQMNKMCISPRIILITDGNTTSHFIQEGPDFSFTRELDEACLMHTVQEIQKGIPVHIDCVPLGESKLDFLTRIAQTTGGKIYQCEDWKKLGRRTKYLDVASRHYQDFLRIGNIDLIRGVIRTRWNIKEEDLDIIEESMRRSKESSKNSTEEEHLSRERINRMEDQLLPIGTRVRRGPDWHWGDQDSHGAGTIIGYDENGLVNVVWDNYDSRGNNSNIYRYAVGGNYDILPVEEPRVLSQGERIAVGCIVRRGKDWISGDQDGGPDSVGTVIETGDRSEKVTVRWPSQKSHKYKFGKKGRYEVQLCDTPESYTSSTMAEKETESVEVKLSKEMDHSKVKDIDVEEMNRRNIEMSKGHITLPDSGGSVKETSSLKPADTKVKMDNEWTKLEHKNVKQNKNR